MCVRLARVLALECLAARFYSGSQTGMLHNHDTDDTRRSCLAYKTSILYFNKATDKV